MHKNSAGGAAAHFSSVDYSVFSALLAIFLVIGLYFGISNRKNQSAEEYLRGGRRMRPLPIAFSLVARYVTNCFPIFDSIHEPTSPLSSVYLSIKNMYFFALVWKWKHGCGEHNYDRPSWNIHIWMAVLPIDSCINCNGTSLKLFIYSRFPSKWHRQHLCGKYWDRGHLVSPLAIIWNWDYLSILIPQYLEMRFCKSVRSIVTVTFVLNGLLFIPIVLYIPSLAFSEGKFYS